MRKILTLIALTLGLLAGPGVGVANADTCLHRSDLRQVERTSLTDSPMSRWQVHQLFNMIGSEVGYGTRVYKGCGDGSRAWLQFVSDTDGIYRVVSIAFTWTYFGDGLTTLHPAREVR